MDLLQKDVPSLTKIYEAKCFYDSQNNRIILYYKNHVTARTLVDFYNLPTTPPPNSSLYVIYDLQTGTFNVSTDPPTYTVSNSKVYVTSPINAKYDMDKVIIYRISSYETTDIDLNYVLTQLNTFVRKQQADTITATHTFDPTEPGPAFQLGPNAQNQLIRYLNADKVDGFDVSQTPAPNVIVPLNEDGILDLSATYVKSNVYTFRRVDLTNVTSDYELQVGEEAIISFKHVVYDTFIPLRISTQSGTYYEMDIVFLNYLGDFVHILLYPNNMSYANAFISRKIYSSGFSQARSHYFEIFSGDGNASVRAYITNFNWFKVVSTLSSEPALCISFWNDESIRWTSLGTVCIYSDYTYHGEGYILVRRLL